MVEQATLTPDRRRIIYNANTGPDRGDVDRRHLFTVPVNAATPAPAHDGNRHRVEPDRRGRRQDDRVSDV